MKNKLNNVPGIYFPLKIMQVYLLFIYILYLFGPVDFERNNVFFVSLLVFSYQISFAIGYVDYISRNKFSPDRVLKAYSLEKILVTNIDRLIIPLTLMYSIISLSIYGKVSFTEILNIPSYILLSIANPLSTYQDSLYSTISSPLVLLLVLLSPIYYYGLIISIYNFKNLSIILKLIVVFIIFLECSRWILQGKNKGVFDVLFYISSVFLICYGQKISTSNNRVSVQRTIKNIISISFLSILSFSAILYFGNAISSRKAFFSNYERFNDIWMVKILPDFLKPIIIDLTDYLVQGYHALSYINEVEWTPMYGIGYSRVLIDNIANILNENIFLSTYQQKIGQFGIDPFVKWHSAYAWLANDFHWIGVVFVMFFIGRLSANLWVNCCLYKDKVSYVLFSFIALSIFYIPANTQVFMQTGTFFSFWCFFVVFLLRKTNIIYYLMK